jgi:hypothetical protein
MPVPKVSFHACTRKASGLLTSIISPIKLCATPRQTQSSSPPLETNALWDTGATNSLITKDTAEALELIPVGVGTIHHGGGQSQSNRYLVNYYLPNEVVVKGVLVNECATIQDGSFGTIIGMDIITRGDFAITNVNGNTCVSYRIPSIATIDYVEEARKVNAAGVGRNDPCPCGSGKKYKKCCGKAKVM